MPHGQCIIFGTIKLKICSFGCSKTFPSDLFPSMEGFDFGSEVRVVRYSIWRKVSTTTHILHSLLFVPSVETCSLRRMNMLSFAHLQLFHRWNEQFYAYFAQLTFCSISGNMFPPTHVILRTSSSLFHQ